jgi:hypothetical protein
MLKFGCVMIVAAALGCGSDGPGTGPLSQSDAQDVCGDICTHEETCGTLGGDTVASCTSECVDDVGGGGYRADVVTDTASCLANLDCGASADTCYACTPTSAHDRYESACRDKLATCGAGQSDIDSQCDASDDDICILTPAVMDAARACFDKDCAMIDECIGQVADQFNL